MRKTTRVIVLVVLVTILTGCAAGPNSVVDTPASSGDVAGFWLGLWHGCIAAITFIISLFNSDVSVYEVHNNGGWYDFGFMLGIGGFSSSVVGGSSQARS